MRSMVKSNLKALYITIKDDSAKAAFCNYVIAANKQCVI